VSIFNVEDDSSSIDVESSLSSWQDSILSSITFEHVFSSLFTGEHSSLLTDEDTVSTLLAVDDFGSVFSEDEAFLSVIIGEDSTPFTTPLLGIEGFSPEVEKLEPAIKYYMNDPSG
jgi:hypothetical protein